MLLIESLHVLRHKLHRLFKGEVDPRSWDERRDGERRRRQKPVRRDRRQGERRADIDRRKAARLHHED